MARRARSRSVRSDSSQVRVRGVRLKEVDLEKLTRAYVDWFKRKAGEAAESVEETWPTERDEERLWAHKVLLMDEFKARVARERAAFLGQLAGMRAIPTLGFDRKVDAPVLADFASDPWCRLARFCFVQVGLER
jgi:hypothetical protein